ncbi:hypothetical protein OG225_11160 [Nocardia sp. NBC_01377]|uniref:hypothetical protein n=1 Tax=Nocardia sp. NBC_01377 TaxID=2903595 RepID=UPI0032445D9E
MKINKFLVLAACIVAAGCASNDDQATDNPSSAAAATTTSSSADCPYRAKSGFCFSAPTGTTAQESTDKVIFARAAEPKAAQDLVIRTESFPATPEFVASRREFARGGTGAADTTVVEDIEIAGGKGFYVATQSTSNVLVTALVPDGDKFHQCTVNVYVTDKDALVNEIQACKSLKLAR